MKRKMNSSQAGYGFVLVLLAVFMLFLGVYIGSSRVAQVEAQEAIAVREKYYTSITIEEGDTLWEIADEYMTSDYDSREDFMDEVRQMNHLTGSVIHAGNTLLVPYYSN